MSINNNAQTSNFKVFIPMFKDIETHVQSIDLPGMNFSLPEVYNNSKRALVGGDAVNLDPVSINFVVDEDMEVYKRVVKYFYECVNPNSGVIQNKDFTCGIEITNNLGKPLFCMQLYGCKIETLSPLEMTNSNEDQELIMNITIRFDDYELLDYLVGYNLELQK